MLCDFHRNGDGYKCKRCGRRVPALGKANCRASRGLGDTMAKLAGFFGFKKKPCSRCRKRQKRLNELFPYS
jgi:hypothetical protein